MKSTPVAVTERMPLASMSNLTSTCGTPRGAGGMPSRPEVAQGLVIPHELTLACTEASTDVSVQRFHAPYSRLSLGKALRHI